MVDVLEAPPLSRPAKSSLLGKRMTVRHDARKEDESALRVEAQMALASAAACQEDLAVALRLYSKVETPQAAWNQSQVSRNHAIP